MFVPHTGMSILGVLVLAGTGGILGALWTGAKKRGQSAAPTESYGAVAGESEMTFAEK